MFMVLGIGRCYSMKPIPAGIWSPIIIIHATLRWTTGSISNNILNNGDEYLNDLIRYSIFHEICTRIYSVLFHCDYIIIFMGLASCVSLYFSWLVYLHRHRVAEISYVSQWFYRLRKASQTYQKNRFRKFSWNDVWFQIHVIWSTFDRLWSNNALNCTRHDPENCWLWFGAPSRRP